MNMDREPFPRSARRTIRLTWMEAVPFAAMTGLTDPFMIPYALALGASAFQAGLLSSARNLILSLSQLGAVRAVRAFRSRKRLVLWAVGAQALMWIPIAFVGPVFGSRAVIALIALFTLGSTCAALAGPAWGSMVSEQLPKRRRATFFGRREMIVGLGTAAAGLVAGVALQLLARRPLLGFGALCLAAALFRGVSWRLLERLDERPWDEPREAHTTFVGFLSRWRHDNFVRFTLCMGLFNLAVHLTVPYLTVYMLTELHYGYFTYSVVVLSGTMVGNLMIPRWGRIGDARGNRVVLRWTMVGASTLPLLWSLWPHPAWMLAMHVAGGFMWGGLNLAAVNFVYDASSPATRARSLAYFNVINGSCVSLGALAGGALHTVLPPLAGSGFIALFVVAGACRCLAAWVFAAVVHEVRPTRQVGLREVMLDLAGTRMVHVLGLLSVRPEREGRARPAPSRDPS